MENSHPSWLVDWFRDHGVAVWGAADLRGFETPADADGFRFTRALSWAIPLAPDVMAGIRHGPNQPYADEYSRVNRLIDTLANGLAAALRARGHRAEGLAASRRTDGVRLAGAFPHKTAATRARIGWVGRHCQLITRQFGPWVRLGTVFTDVAVPCGPPIERSFCGTCTRCADACPAKALKGKAWHPGLPREEMLDAQACDTWKKEHYYRYHRGHNCGICSAVCPYGTKALEKSGGMPQSAGRGASAR